VARQRHRITRFDAPECLAHMLPDVETCVGDGVKAGSAVTRHDVLPAIGHLRVTVSVSAKSHD
jgi:hypothetical protein